MVHDPNPRGHLPSRVPLMRLFGSPVQESPCTTSLVFVRPARKNQVIPDVRVHGHNLTLILQIQDIRRHIDHDLEAIALAGKRRKGQPNDE